MTNEHPTCRHCGARLPTAIAPDSLCLRCERTERAERAEAAAEYEDDDPTEPGCILGDDE